MLLSLPQVAKMFSVSENVVTLWVRQRNLPAQEVNSQYRFDRADLLEWAATTGQSFLPEIFGEMNGDLVTEVSLADAIERGGVSTRVAGNDRYEVLSEVVGSLPLPPSFDRDGLLDLMLAREKSGGTAIGNGIAIPHPRYPVVLAGHQSLVRTCYLEQPLEFRASDGKPVHTLFLMICPTVHEHLQLLARLAGVLRMSDFLTLLLTRPDVTELVSAVRAAEVTFAENTK